MNYSRQRTQLIATAALCILIVGLGAGVVAQRLAASRISHDIERQKQLLTRARQDAKDRAVFRNDFHDLSLKLGGRMSTCSWSDQMPFMMAQVTSIVEANGLKVESLQPEPMTSNGSIQRFPMRLGLQADMKHLAEVLKDLKSSVPLIDIERLEVRNAQGESGKLQMNLTVATFVVLDKGSPVAVRRSVKPVKPAKTEQAKAVSAETRTEADEEVKGAAKPASARQEPAVRRGGGESRRSPAPEEPGRAGNGKPQAPSENKPAPHQPPSDGKVTAPPSAGSPSEVRAVEGRSRRGERR